MPGDTATEILVVSGTLSLVYTCLLGIAMGQVRMNAPQTPRHLVTTHIDGLIVGAIHLSLTVAIAFSPLPSWLETLAAIMLAAGAALSLSGGTLNWLSGVGDQFAAKNPGFILQALSGPITVIAMLILLAGVLQGL